MTTLVLTRQQIREQVIAMLEPRFGIMVSPEFRAVITPHPKEKVVLGGVQAGKSWELASEFLVSILSLPLEQLMGHMPDREYLYWIVMPSYMTPTKEMHYLHSWFSTLGAISRWNNPQGAPTRLELYSGKIIIETRTAQDMAGIASEPIDGLGAAEAGQMGEEIRTRALERTVTRDGWIVYSGTLENDQAKPQFAWYAKLGRKWLDNPEPDGLAFSLPTWANIAIHPLGRNSPSIIAEQRRWLDAGMEYMYNRRILGIPDGVQYPIYGDFMTGEWGAGDVSTWQFNRALNAGGHDWGTTHLHPSTLVPVQVSLNNIAVVRDYFSGLGAPVSELESRRRLMSQRWNITNHRWGFDPQLKRSAQEEGAQAVAMGKGSRMRRVEYVQSRAKERRILFDMDVLESDPPDEVARKHRVRALFDQLRRVHLIKRELPGQGEVFEYDRTDDDGAAALEDAIEVIDGKRRRDYSKWNNR